MTNTQADHSSYFKLLSLFSKSAISNESAYQAFFEYAPVAMVIIDPAPMTITHANIKALRLFGYSLKELIGKSVNELTYVGDRIVHTIDFENIGVEVNRDLAIEKRYVRKDGSFFWSQSGISALRSPDGKIELFVGTLIDITGRKKAEDFLLFQNFVLNRTTDGIVLAQKSSGLIKYTNPQLNRMFGYEPEELIDLHVNVLHGLGKDHLQFKADNIAKALEQSGKWEGEVCNLRKDGTKFWSHTSIALFDHPELGCVSVSTLSDITKSKQTDLEIRAAEMFREVAGKLARLGTWNIELPGHQITLSNALCEILDLPTGTQLTSEDAFELFTEESRAKFRSAISKCIETGTGFIEVLQLKTANGNTLNVRVIGTPLQNQAGETMRLEGVLQDITETSQVEDIIRQSLNRTKIFIQKMPISIAMFDREMKYIAYSERWLKEYGRDHSNLIGFTHYQIHPDLSDEWKRVHQQGLKGITTTNDNDMWVQADGSKHYLRWAVLPWMDQDGLVGGIIISAEDITDQQRSHEELRIAATAFESQEGILVADSKGNILRVNSAFTAITGYENEEVAGKNPRLLSSGRQDAEFYKHMWDCINSTGKWKGEIWNRRKNGEIYPELLTITAVKNASGDVCNYVATLLDITSSKESEEIIRNLAFFDPLTKLPNRRLLHDRLHQAMSVVKRNKGEGAILFIDFDNFKNINDTLGHAIGDALLEQIAQRITGCVREDDTVARLGGDEFVVLLSGLSQSIDEAVEQTEAIGEKIRIALNVPYQLGASRLNGSASIGATMFDDKSSQDELLKQADIAMYQSKNSGRNALRFFDPRMQEAIDARAVLEVDLRDAIEKHQFQLYFQLQADSSGLPIGAEALIRWVHPERGVVSPAEFIPFAEERDLILPIGNWVLYEACKQIKAWESDANMSDLTLSVNVSAKQFHQIDFADHVQLAVQGHAIDPGKLKIELTETMLIENIDETIVKMNQLKMQGILLSLDDFGTGYSSLKYLQKLPLDQLKIDQSFVYEIGRDANDSVIVQTIIRMAKSLGLDVIAEGVETAEQMEFLVLRGCEKFQGYFFARPLPLNQFCVLERQLRMRALKLS